ncbi:MAG TPA: hypoxanthine-guanine phosphoribosyltransferase [Thiotrichales bacterium]|nr:hypoxanthine-guanine phosphoribosyltransferase [Thiotrichales bacterium]
MSISADEAQRVWQEADCLYDAREVEEAITVMADEIAARVGGRNPVLLCVMNGGIVLTGKLMTHLAFPLQLDYIHATRYRGGTSGGDLLWRVEPQLSMKGRTVLVVDDILDEGITLQRIVEWCRGHEAEEVLTAVLVEKRHDRKYGMAGADFAALEVEDLYVFGFGMDYKNYLRNAAGIYAVAGM